MKKLLFSVAILAAAASCSQNEIVETKLAKSIGFSVLNDNVTRAEITGKANDADDSYHVIAVSDAASAEDYYINDELGKATDNTSYVWPTDATTYLDFYAIAPNSVGATVADFNASNTNNILTLNNYEIQGDVDVTVAAPIMNQKKDSNSGNVEFKFSHMLAKVIIEVKLDEDLTTAGYVLKSDDNGIINGAAINPNAYIGNLDASATTPAFTDATGTEDENYAYTFNGENVFYILPQSSIGCYVQGLNIAIETTAGVSVFKGDLSWYEIVAGNIPDDKFEAGKAYKLTLTINSSSTGKPEGPTTPPTGDPIFTNQIKFSANLIDWTEAEDSNLTQN